MPFLHLTHILTGCPMAAATTRQILLLKATFSVLPGPSQTSPTSIPGTTLNSLTLLPAACRLFAPTASKTSNRSQTLIFKRCCCPAFTPTARLIPVLQSGLTLTPRPSTLLCSLAGGLHRFLLSRSLFHTLRQASLPTARPPLTLTHPAAL